MQKLSVVTNIKTQQRKAINMTHKYTLGEWRVDGNLIVTDDVDIASVYGCGKNSPLNDTPPREEAMANLNLIAAAPMMLQQLERTARILGNVQPDDEATLAQLLKELVSAIDVAKGDF